MKKPQMQSPEETLQDVGALTADLHSAEVLVALPSGGAEAEGSSFVVTELSPGDLLSDFESAAGPIDLAALVERFIALESGAAPEELKPVSGGAADQSSADAWPAGGIPPAVTVVIDDPDTSSSLA